MIIKKKVLLKNPFSSILDPINSNPKKHKVERKRKTIVKDEKISKIFKKSKKELDFHVQFDILAVQWGERNPA